MLEELRRATAAPTSAGLALPFAAYRDPEIHALEMERLFRGDWVAVCAAAELAAAGSYVALEIGGEPVAVIRGQDKTLRALSNVCRHRGTLLLDSGRGEIGQIVCPYHAWAYADDGAFKGAPHTGCIEIDPKRHALPQFALEIWAGVVFVNVDGRAEPLHRRLAGIESHLAAYGIERYDTPVSSDAPETWQANWKIAFENGIESYHLFKVHKKTLEAVSPTRGAYYLEGSAEWTATGGTTEAYGQAYPGEPATLDADQRRRYVLVSLPPSFVGVLTRDSWGWIAIHPDAPAQSRVTLGALAPKVVADYSRGDGRADEFTRAFLEEDRLICERGQRGMAARHSEGGQLVELERVVADFHQYLGARLFGQTPDAGYRETRPVE